ncbi:hypothetical protein M501DRAFT_998488 [Patellaria atrata CBS 101060]|uniref:Uncharacterized protein n=1 Tax=Patellaria atrata CBS 101060 TaxID=1346257 RepID=A0A9P4VQS8_9PEZI|nr:hypothetical protein M501DRAFT_998488 [Patellaria atrata CBS 101060]
MTLTRGTAGMVGYLEVWTGRLGWGVISVSRNVLKGHLGNVSFEKHDIPDPHESNRLGYIK